MREKKYHIYLTAEEQSRVIQDTLGHKDITTTLNTHTDVTKELKKTEFEGLDKYFDNSIA